MLIMISLGSKQSKAKLKIVEGHRTIKVAGHHGNSQELEELLVPILEINESTFGPLSSSYIDTLLVCLFLQHRS
ncbi:purple acid phosphatase 8 [Trifolium medium]|uniref:Purple acid phosphatase 8 n=1 Tax=Trifolium medium TaxID=97028 RepID=A0A392NLM4_9FABA|nr:purple acid phosphatase 8 [Trifolium medium]